MRKSLKKISLLLTIVMILGAFVGCSSKPADDNTKDGADVQKKDTLVIATENEPPSLSSVDHDSISSVYMNMLTYNGLIKINADTLEAVPDLAESYSVENDVNWIFKLKQGVKFHDGTELKAADVVASIEWSKTFPASSNYTQKIAKIEAVDDYTVKITTDEPYAGLLYDLGYHFNLIVPKALIESGNDFSENPIGTGPYKFVKWSRGDSIEFIKNDNYFDKEAMPSITSLIWRFIPEGTSRTIALEAGEVDFVYEVESTDIERLKTTEGIEVSEVTSVVNWFLALNKDKTPFDDVNVRKAINTAIDRDSLISAALNGFGIPSISCVPMGHWGSTDEFAEGYDLEKAKAYLKEWGGDASTIKLPIICSNDTKTRLATVIQANLAEIGIVVEIVSMDLATYLDKMSSGDYDGAIMSWSPSNALTYIQRFHSRRREGNPGSLNSPEVDVLVVKAETTIDDAERLKLINDTIKLTDELCPQPSLYQDIIFRAYKADLVGVVPSATGYVYFNKVSWK